MPINLKRDTIFVCKRFFVEELKVDISSETRIFYVINKPNAVGVIATKDSKIALVEQFRPLRGRSIFELPGGMLEAAEDKISAAKREIVEETGYEVEDISEFEGGLFDHSLSSECLTIFVATLGNYVGKSLDKEEADLRVRFIPIDQLKEMIHREPESLGDLDRLLLKLWLYKPTKL